MKRILVVCTLLAVSLAAFAQDKAAAKPKKEAKAAAPASGMPPMPKPSPEMKKLIATFAGSYTSTMKMDAMMGMPASTSTGPAKFYPGPGGLSLMETVSAVDQEHGGKFSGWGVTWWDAKAGVFKSIWCDNGTPSGCADGFISKWDGTKLVGTGSMEMMGKNYNLKGTYTDFSADGFNYVMEGGEGSAMAKMFVVEYKKAAAAPKPATGK